jgi:hypothetical protein
MRNKRSLMKLSLGEVMFLRHWMYDEAHYEDREGPAKLLQLEHRVISADLATLIAAAIPDPADQETAGLGPPPAAPPSWPWSEETLQSRLAQARAVLAEATSTESSSDS